MREYQFVASTLEGEKKSGMLGAAALLVPFALLFVVFKGLLPNLITNDALRWLVVIVPSLVSFFVMMRLLERHYVGVFTIRMEGKHITLVHPDRSVTDLGAAAKAAFTYSADYKRADLALFGSKDEIVLRLRSASSWNGKSAAKDFSTVDKAVADINAALLQQKAA